MARRAAARIVLPARLLVICRIVAACLVYLAVLDGVVVLVYGIAEVVVPGSVQGTFGTVGLGLAEAAALGSVLVMWRVVDRRPIRALGLYPDHAVRRWLKGCGVALLMMGFVVLVGYTLIDGAAWDVNADAVRAGIALVGGFIGFAIQGPAEEILFRGYILENVRAQWGVRQAVVVSSLAFGLLHAYNPGFGPLPFVNLVLFGVAMALYKLYVDDNQLWGVFAIHSMWNWLQQVVFGLPNSGITTVSDSVLFSVTPNTALPGPFWGSGFGPEGTFAATLVLLALIGVGVRRMRAAAREQSAVAAAVPTATKDGARSARRARTV